MNTLFLAARCKFWLRASDHSEKSLIPYSNAHSKNIILFALLGVSPPKLVYKLVKVPILNW